MSLLTPRTVATTLDTMRTFRGMIMESRPVKLMLRGASVYRWHSMSGFMIMMHASCAVGVDRCRHEVRRILALGMAIMHPTHRPLAELDAVPFQRWTASHQPSADKHHQHEFEARCRHRRRSPTQYSQDSRTFPSPSWW